VVRIVGSLDGFLVSKLGFTVGSSVGFLEGLRDGLIVGILVGLEDGMIVGLSDVGKVVGVVEGR
jgi:hypothetical protein